MAICLLIESCSGRRGGDSSSDTGAIPELVSEDKPTTINFFVENSGSMKGYFSGRSTSDLETLINEYYDRLKESSKVDTTTLSFINTQVEKTTDDISHFLRTVKSKCNAKYTKIDDILKMSMDAVDENNINIVISDYCFDSDTGNLAIAQSHITKLFTEYLNMNSDMSIAIIKYMVGFDGYYFPKNGSIPCKRDMPVYFWIFGKAKQIKRITSLNLKTKSCGTLLLQIADAKTATIEMKNKRAIQHSKDGDKIVVKHWEAKRHSATYCASVLVDLTDMILNDSDLEDVNNYSIRSNSSSRYWISSISKKDNKHSFDICTDKPSPGEVDISFSLQLPNWIEKSNFEGNGLPSDSTTLGIKYLIGGAFDAYYNRSTTYFSFKINII